jgi:hypothetical protein
VLDSLRARDDHDAQFALRRLAAHGMLRTGSSRLTGR